MVGIPIGRNFWLSEFKSPLLSETAPNIQQNPYHKQIFFTILMSKNTAPKFRYQNPLGDDLSLYVYRPHASIIHIDWYINRH